MGTLLVTVVHGVRRRDLAVRSDVPIADLLRPLTEALAGDAPPARRLRSAHPGAAPARVAPNPAERPRGAEPNLTEQLGEAAGQGLALTPLCGQPLPVERSLEACGVGHGAVLVLIDGSPGSPSPSARRPGARARAPGRPST